MKSRVKLLRITVIAGLASSYAYASDPAPTASAEMALSSREASAEEGPSVSVARRVVDAAGAFERYFQNAAAINSDFNGAVSVSSALMASAAYEPRQLEEGAVAYAALVALQQPTFVEGFSSFSADPSERRAYIERLTATPDLVLTNPGAGEAAAMASAALQELGSRLVSRGQAVTQAAYSVQQQPWALEPVPEPAERLARIQAAGLEPARLSEHETDQLLARLVAQRSGPQTDAAPSQPAPTVMRGLAVAAAAILGQANENRAEALSPLLREPNNGGCLRRAKLNLHQCLAASGPEYEDVFCAGQHAMAETGQCILKAAGGVRADGVKVPIARAYARNASATVAVPVARSAGEGRGLTPVRTPSDAGPADESPSQTN